MTLRERLTQPDPLIQRIAAFAQHDPVNNLGACKRLAAELRADGWVRRAGVEQRICVAEMNDDGWVCGAPIDGEPHNPQDPTKHDPVWRLLVPVGDD